MINWLGKKLTDWLIRDHQRPDLRRCDFERLSFEIRPGDVLLVEGRSRVSEVIKTITQSQWTHAALYIGRLHDIEDDNAREHVSWCYDGDATDQLIIEPMLGEGTIVTPLRHYADDHVRICRPKGLTPNDARRVVNYAIQHLGKVYDVRHLLDLARFIFPYSFLPRRWRSSLFEHNAGTSTKTVCSTLIAEAFSAIHFPVLPVIHRTENGQLKLYRRNTKLYVPKDFDNSPYFEIIKYPLLGLDDVAIYRQLPWDKDGVVCNDENECYVPGTGGIISMELDAALGNDGGNDSSVKDN